MLCLGILNKFINLLIFEFSISQKLSIMVSRIGTLFQEEGVEGRINDRLMKKIVNEPQQFLQKNVDLLG